jgi:subtilisin family serine protease
MFMKKILCAVVLLFPSLVFSEEYLIEIKGSATKEDVAVLSSKLKKPFKLGLNKVDIHSKNPQKIVDYLKTFKAVETVEPNNSYTPHAVSNDPYVTGNNLWGMGGGFGSNAVTAWANNHTDCSGVVVAVMDSGVFRTHPDLEQNLWVNNLDSTYDRTDNDGNGLIDDVNGWDFVFHRGFFSSTIYKSSSTLDGQHGTHVAGTIGAVGGNSLGVAGVCWSVKIITLSVCYRDVCFWYDVASAMDYLVALKQRGVNIVAVNTSFGGAKYSSVIHAKINSLKTAGILVVASAGNAGNDVSVDKVYPASFPENNVISVAAINSLGNLSSFSNYSSTEVDIAAPGENIASTFFTKSNLEYSTTYQSWQGTSMAAPHVTGAAALWKAYHPSATYLDIRNAILNNATPTTSLSGKTVTGGRLNVGNF